MIFPHRACAFGAVSRGGVVVAVAEAASGAVVAGAPSVSRAAVGDLSESEESTLQAGRLHVGRDADCMADRGGAARLQ